MCFFCVYILTTTFYFRPNSDVNSCSVKVNPNKRMQFRHLVPLCFGMSRKSALLDLQVFVFKYLSESFFFVRSLHYSADVPALEVAGTSWNKLKHQLHNYMNSLKLLWYKKCMYVQDNPGLVVISWFLSHFLYQKILRALHYCSTEGVCASSHLDVTWPLS